MALASAVDGAIWQKMCGWGVIMTSRVGVARAGKGIALVITNEDADNIIRILKSLENSGVLIDEVSEIVKSDKKRQPGFLGMLLGILGVSMLRNVLTEKCLMRVRKSALTAGRGNNNVDHIDKKF